MSFKVLCPDCDYNSRRFRYHISAMVVAENHELKTGHSCLVRHEWSNSGVSVSQ